MRRPILAVISTMVLMTAVSLAVPSFAQDSDFSLNVHANSHATAKDIGLPVYPGDAVQGQGQRLIVVGLGVFAEQLSIQRKGAELYHDGLAGACARVLQEAAGEIRPGAGVRPWEADGLVDSDEQWADLRRPKERAYGGEWK